MIIRLIEYFSLGSCLALLSMDTMDRRDSLSLCSISFSRLVMGMQDKILLLERIFSMTATGIISTRVGLLDIRDIVKQGIFMRNQGSVRKCINGRKCVGGAKDGRDG